MVRKSIERHSRRSFSHVLKKGVETIPPSFTDRNSPASVIGIGPMVSIKASLFHVLPRTVCSGPQGFVGGTMAVLRMCLFGKATTTSAFPACKYTAFYHPQVATRATAEPFGGTRVEQDRPSPKNLPGNVFEIVSGHLLPLRISSLLSFTGAFKALGHATSFHAVTARILFAPARAANEPSVIVGDSEVGTVATAMQNVFEIWMNTSRILVSHADLLCRSMVRAAGKLTLAFSPFFYSTTLRFGEA
jgi:hypothetical protein